MNWLTPDTWIISDTHFNHANIVKYCGRPADHTFIIERNWHAYVGENDPILHLGDVFFGPSSEASLILNDLPGDKYMLRGNHDKKNLHWYAEHGFKIVGDQSKIFYEYLLPFGNRRVLLSHYPDVHWLDRWDINIHGHIHNNGYAPGVSKKRDYRNVSIEVVSYRPWRLRDIVQGNVYQSRIDADDWAPELVEKLIAKGSLTDKLVEVEKYD